jgi:hypothetical protein
MIAPIEIQIDECRPDGTRDVSYQDDIDMLTEVLTIMYK